MIQLITILVVLLAANERSFSFCRTISSSAVDIRIRFQLCRGASETNEQSNTERNPSELYKDEDIRLRAFLPQSYAVILPKGMDPDLTAAEKIVAERKEAAKAENPGKTDLDLLKEELRRMISQMEEKQS
jgi:hypothetical protein